MVTTLANDLPAGRSTSRIARDVPSSRDHAAMASPAAVTPTAGVESDSGAPRPLTPESRIRSAPNVPSDRPKAAIIR
jgi:hypothetical protein